MQAYEEYFRYLDQTGGFFYERWGDAPVHSLGAVMLLNSTEVRRIVVRLCAAKTGPTNAETTATLLKLCGWPQSVGVLKELHNAQR